MPPTQIPEIQRVNLANTLLQLKAMGINDVIGFDYMDAPPRESINAALDQLCHLKALNKNGRLTELGRMVRYFVY